MAEDAMKLMKSLAIDNTNHIAADNTDFIKLAKTTKYPVRGLFWD